MITILKVQEGNTFYCYIYYTMGTQLYMAEVNYAEFAEQFGLFDANLELVAEYAEQYIADLTGHDICDHEADFYNSIL